VSETPLVPPPPFPLPRIEPETGRAARLAIAPEASTGVAALPEPGASTDPRWGMPLLVLSGFAVLALGLAGLQTGNFVAAQFARSVVLGWLTLAVAGAGFGLILAGIWRELRGLAALQGVDRRRRSPAARRWLGMVLPALDALNDPDSVLPLLRAGVEAGLRRRADALGRRAAMQVVAGMAATPAPSLVVLLISWRGLRLIRQIAALYGLRPGLFGTLGLLRRTATAATAAAVTEVAINSAAHAVLSTPLLTHLAGEMAGGAVAARRMVVLGRAASVACTPLPPD
jgi:putative membrane protein